MDSKKLSQTQKMLQEQGYIDDSGIAMSVFLAMQLEKPLLVEGPAGVGKTEIAKVMAKALHTDLIRLQCYEGLDSTHALYEWNYQHQLLYLKMQEHQGKDTNVLEQTIFLLFINRKLFLPETAQESYPKHYAEDVSTCG